MPVHGLVYYTTPSMATFLGPAQDYLVKSFLAQYMKKWIVQYKLYRNVLSPKSLELLKQNIHPYMYACVDEMTTVEAEPALEDIIIRTKLWTFRQTFNIEGAIYEVGDFTVAVANVLQKSTWKGIVFHVTYDGSDDVDTARPILQEFFDICFFKNASAPPPVYENYFYHSRHSIDPKLFLEIFKHRVDISTPSSLSQVKSEASPVG
ncbi:mediator complex subunit Med20 [Schizosaccharomyces osmophilus]|uniref:Mediator of RNA polymerase II transcription subunit 20 n=1 Tax=Schizosaccharomyces osmophilus TaxID=2545709 RepID=A0AAF0AWF7_9SCHI|nr:mediator complex subunit Med20 [Schizosaccharomyces osmophilus]WBW73592.1 mediator complex subunit Med20 [Schizosaccharomyces osmophilus]